MGCSHSSITVQRLNSATTFIQAHGDVGWRPGPLRLEHIVAVVKPGHVASQRVLEKAGLRNTGTREVYDEQMLLYEADRNGRATHW